VLWTISDFPVMLICRDGALKGFLHVLAAINIRFIDG